MSSVSNLILALYVLATSAALIVLKMGASTGAPVALIENKLQFNLNPYTVSGIILYGISFVLYMYLISKFELGYIIPITAAFVYILIFVASFLIFKEIFTPAKIIGIAMIVIGLIILQVGQVSK